MVRGPRKHLKRLNAPKHWMLDKLGGTWAPRPSAGPHKLRESLPLILFLRNRLKYALTRREVVQITAQRFIKVDGKVRTDVNYPAGFMDVISIEKTNEFFRLLYDAKGRFTVHRITPEEAKFKLLRIRRIDTERKGVPTAVTHDGRNLRYIDPLIKANDTVKYNLETGKIEEFVKFELGAIAMITSGANVGRVGIIESREKHMGGFEIIHLKDTAGNRFATRLANVFVIGKQTPWVSLTRSKGIKLSVIEERDLKAKIKAAPAAN
jgi:small subunit ribosomal protein S4e